MTRQETVSILAILRAAFPSFYKGMERKELAGIVSLWHDMFQGDASNVVAGAVKAYRERRRHGVRREAIEKAIQLWEALMAKQRYEMPPEEWRRLQPFYVLTVEALKNERDRAAKRGGAKKGRETGGGS